MALFNKKQEEEKPRKDYLAEVLKHNPLSPEEEPPSNPVATSVEKQSKEEEENSKPKVDLSKDFPAQLKPRPEPAPAKSPFELSDAEDLGHGVRRQIEKTEKPNEQKGLTSIQFDADGSHSVPAWSIIKDALTTPEGVVPPFAKRNLASPAMDVLIAEEERIIGLIDTANQEIELAKKKIEEATARKLKETERLSMVESVLENMQNLVYFDEHGELPAHRTKEKENIESVKQTVLVTPAVRRKAKELGIKQNELSRIKGSGVDGALKFDDLERYADSRDRAM